MLIGFSCTGKTSVGRLLAEVWGWDFLDTDAEVERAGGKRIQAIFAEDGEALFRRLEREAVARALEGGPRTVALGGGAIMDPATRERIRRGGHLVVLLEAEVDTILRRLAGQASDVPRPLLASPDPRAQVLALQSEREAVYRQEAAVAISTDGLEVGEVAGRVAAAARRLLLGREREGQEG